MPFRRQSDGLAFCLITSLKKRRWILPKGIIEDGETAEETALKESLEEAGLHGRIVGRPLGEYRDSKWGTTLEVTAMLMEVERFDDEWLESHMRSRRWAGRQEALALLHSPDQREMLKRGIDRLRSDNTPLF